MTRQMPADNATANDNKLTTVFQPLIKRKSISTQSSASPQPENMLATSEIIPVRVKDLST